MHIDKVERLFRSILLGDNLGGINFSSISDDKKLQLYLAFGVGGNGLPSIGTSRDSLDLLIKTYDRLSLFKPTRDELSANPKLFKLYKLTLDSLLTRIDDVSDNYGLHFTPTNPQISEDIISASNLIRGLRDKPLEHIVRQVSLIGGSLAKKLTQEDVSLKTLKELYLVINELDDLSFLNPDVRELKDILPIIDSVLTKKSEDYNFPSNEFNKDPRLKRRLSDEERSVNMDIVDGIKKLNSAFMISDKYQGISSGVIKHNVGGSYWGQDFASERVYTFKNLSQKRTQAVNDYAQMVLSSVSNDAKFWNSIRRSLLTTLNLNEVGTLSTMRWGEFQRDFNGKYYTPETRMRVISKIGEILCDRQDIVNNVEDKSLIDYSARYIAARLPKAILDPNSTNLNDAASNFVKVANDSFRFMGTTSSAVVTAKINMSLREIARDSAEKRGYSSYWINSLPRL